MVHNNRVLLFPGAQLCVLAQLRLWKEDVVFKVDVFVEVVLEFLQLLVGNHEGIAGIGRQRIVVREMADGVNRIADFIVLPAPARRWLSENDASAAVRSRHT